MKLKMDKRDTLIAFSLFNFQTAAAFFFLLSRNLLRLGAELNVHARTWHNFRLWPESYKDAELNRKSIHVVYVYLNTIYTYVDETKIVHEYTACSILLCDPQETAIRYVGQVFVAVGTLIFNYYIMHQPHRNYSVKTPSLVQTFKK